MADCGDSPYQAIEYRGLFDLKDAQVVRAEIVAIDRIALTAEVTLLDECDSADGLDIEAVPFFYHCETSTGTVEDLEKGHKAFVGGDMVYILLTKENGEEPAQAFIIGHVDIRGTRVCTTDILLVTQYFYYTSAWVTVYIIINPVTGTLFDVAGFANFDGGSPAKPTSNIGVYTTAVSDWVAYNFISVSNSYTAPCDLFTLTTNKGGVLPASIIAIDPWISTTGLTDYSGEYQHTVGSGDACESINTGNGYMHWLQSETGPSSPPVTGSSYSAVDEWNAADLETYHPGGVETTCNAAWASMTVEHDITHTHITNFGWSLTDSVQSVTAPMPIKVEAQWVNRVEYFFDPVDGSLTGGLDMDLTVTHTVDHSDLFGAEQVHTYSLNSFAELNTTTTIGAAVSVAPASASGGFIEIPSTVSVGTFHPDLWRAYEGGTTFTGSGTLIGDDGIYMVFGGAYSQSYKMLTTSSVTFALIAFNTTFGWNLGPSYPMALSGSTQSRFSVFLDSAVTPYDAVIDPSSPLSVLTCAANRNLGSSAALTESVLSLYDYISTNYTQNDATKVQAAYRTYSSTHGGDRGIFFGPTYRLIKKKV